MELYNVKIILTKNETIWKRRNKRLSFPFFSDTALSSFAMHLLKQSDTTDEKAVVWAESGGLCCWHQSYIFLCAFEQVSYLCLNFQICKQKIVFVYHAGVLWELSIHC